LVAPNWKKEVQVYVDVSNIAIGSVLSQKDDKSFNHPIYFASKQLIVIEINYTITKIKTLGMIYFV
jgi:hypothetical protein